MNRRRNNFTEFRSSTIFRIIAVLLLASTPVMAQDVLTAEQSSGSYIAGADLTITANITYSDTLSALGFEVKLPEGWTYVPNSAAGDGKPADGRFVPATGIIEFFWISIPADKVNFTYKVHVPESSMLRQEITARVLYCRATCEEMIPDPLYIEVSEDSYTLTASHESGFYVPGSPLTVSNQITYTGGVSALGIQVNLPDGWTYLSHSGDGSPDKRVLDNGDVEFFWTSVPASPARFTYTVNVPSTETQSRQIKSLVLYRRTADEIQKDVLPNPLSVSKAVSNGYLKGSVTPKVPTLITTGAGIQLTTLSDGTFTVPHEAGTFTLTAEAEGYELYSSIIDIREGQTSEISIILIPSAPDTEPAAVIKSPAGDQTINQGQSLLFTGEAQSGNAPFSYSWNFSGGATNTGTKDAGTVSFFRSGIYPVTFTVIDNDGDRSTAALTVIVNKVDTNLKPAAAIASPASDMTVTVGESLDFQGTVTSGNPPFRYFWDFKGGAQNFNIEDPGNVTFHTLGTYPVLFSVSDNEGDMSSASVTVTVKSVVQNLKPLADIASPSSDMVIYEGGSLDFQGTVSDGNAPFTYLWNFGGAAADMNVEDPGSVVFYSEGVYMITFTVAEADTPDDKSSKSVVVTVKKAENDTKPVVSVTSPPSDMTINEGESVDFKGLVTDGNAPFAYSWDFSGAAANSNEENPGSVTFQTAGTYAVTFAVTDADGDVAAASVTVTVKKSDSDTNPAAFIISPPSDMTINEGEAVNFQGDVTEGNAPFTYMWDFSGASAASNLEDPGTLTFHNEGVYPVTFTVIDNDGDSHTASVTVTVKKVYDDLWPDAYISSPAADMSINEGESVNFQGVVMSGNAPFFYYWNFGGGAVNSNDEDPGQITFQQAGVYTVTFMVSDLDGDSDSNSVTITVNKVIPDLQPKAAIVSPPSIMTVNEGESVNFQGDVTDGNAPFAYRWDFDNAAADASVEDPGDVTFESKGTYTVVFKVTDKDGDTAQASVIITVKSPATDMKPIASIVAPVSDVTITEGESVNFYGSVIYGNAPFVYSWNFSGGTSDSDVEDPGQVYFYSEGEYPVTFTVTDKDGDKDSISLRVTVKPRAISGYMITSDLWIGAVINTLEKGRIEAVWKKGGEDWTDGGHQVIWGYFYASPTDVNWGSAQNPDLFVKIWFDASGRVDVNYFHVSVPNIEVYSDYPYNGTPDWHGTTTLDTRYIRQYYNDYNNPDGKVNGMEENTEDGVAIQGEQYLANGNPAGYVISDLDMRIGAILRTVEKGHIDALWRQGGISTTAGGHQVAWGLFYADPNVVNWGSEQNPDLFVKIWFDASGRVDVNYFHVSVPEIEVYSDFPASNSYDQKGTTIMADRYIRHEYYREVR